MSTIAHSLATAGPPHGGWREQHPRWKSSRPTLNRMTQPPSNTEMQARSYQFMASELRRVLSEFTDGQLRDHCADQARRFTNAMFRLGAITEDGAATGAMPGFRPGPHVIPDALVGTMTSDHVGKVVTFYHQAHNGDVRAELERLADWSDGVAEALLNGGRVPPCVYCAGDHTPQR